MFFSSKLGALVVALFAGCLLAACGNEDPVRIEIPPGEDPTIWAADIAAFEALDAERPALPGSVVFVGSSSIRLWDSLVRDMAPRSVIKRGFGGSRLFDSIYYAEELITRHDPAAIVVFSGTNDLAEPNPKSSVQVAQLFVQLVLRIRELGCEAPLAYLAITPTPARAEFLAEINEANRLIRELCASDARLQFVDTAPAFLNATGEPDPALFVEDGLHLKPEGYAFWAARLKPVLETWAEEAAATGDR